MLHATVSNSHVTGVLMERPQPQHKPVPPETGGLILAAMLFAAFIGGIMLLVHFGGKDKKPAAVATADDPVGDAQEWAAYPRPEDAKSR